MKNLENEIRTMDFQYFGTGSHMVSASAFLSKKEMVFLDVRTSEEIKNVKLPLTSFCPVLEIPMNELPDRIAEIPKDKFVGIFCPASVRASMIFIYLKSLGYDRIRIIIGGYAALIDELKPGKIYKKINQ